MRRRDVLSKGVEEECNKQIFWEIFNYNDKLLQKKIDKSYCTIIVIIFALWKYSTLALPSLFIVICNNF